jgi:Fe-S-cluster containining protein
MDRFKCNKKAPCLRCGGCCHIREKEFLDKDEDLQVRKGIYAKAGIIYLYPMSRYTISLTNEEKTVMEKLAKEKKIKLRVLPKKVVIQDDKVIVIDWFVDHEVCPFYKDNECTIYEHRPKVCSIFPEVHNKNIFEDIRVKPIMLFEQAVEIAQNALNKKI